MMHRNSPARWMTPSCLSILALAVVFAAAFANANDSTGASLGSDPRVTADVQAVRRAAPSVVNIHSVKVSYDDATVFGTHEGRKVNGMGTGIVIDPRGYIVTNHHVVSNVESLQCTLANGSSFDAKTIAVDPERDLAIIKVETTEDLPVIPLGTSSDLMLCETVIAIGNAFGYEHTVTKGIISALHRNVEVNETQSYKNLIQTDASINPGNSGGPLLNMRGEVIGINVAIRAGAQRIGFAIPIDDARVAIAELIDIERMDHHSHGLQTTDVKSADTKQLVITGCKDASPAEVAGFRKGDIVVSVSGKAIADRVDLERLLLNKEPAEPVEVVVERNGSETVLELALQSLGANTTQVAAATPQADAKRDIAWTILGLRLGSAPGGAVKGTKYDGGLEVLSVREGSPAALTGIRSGDILVGLHEWATVKTGDVDWVLKHPDLKTFSPLRFYVLGNRGEGQKTLMGRLMLASGK